MIVVEGPDGSGKTRLCRHLEEALNLDYRRYPKLSSTHGPDGPDIADWWDLEIAEDMPNRIYDRCFYVSEIIYQLATPGRDLIVPAPKMVQGIQRLAIFEPQFIFCRVPWDVAISNIGQRDRLLGVDDHALEKIHWAYDSFCAMWVNALEVPPVLEWNYTTDEPEAIVEQVKKYLTEWAQV